MELLVVIIVIAILGALLYPAIQDSINSKDKMVSTNRLRNVMSAIRLYGVDNNDIIICPFEQADPANGVPGQGTFYFVLTSEKYLPGNGQTCIEFGCEVQKRMHHFKGVKTFNMNGRIGNFSRPAGATRFIQLVNPSKTALVMHGIWSGTDFSRGVYEGRYYREAEGVFNDKVLIGFADGNIQLVDPTTVPSTNTSTEGKLFWLGK